MGATDKEGDWEGKYQGFGSGAVWLLVFQVFLDILTQKKSIGKLMEKMGNFIWSRNGHLADLASSYILTS